jgi:predicted nucleic acid-binding protein
MILMDTSAWIRYFKKGGISFEQLKTVAVCPPVVQEILQGIKDPARLRSVHDGLLSLPCLASPTQLSTYIHAAEIFRRGRQKGYTIRSSIDCLVAAMAIEGNCSVHHFDRDFDVIAKFTSLQVSSKL